MKTRHSGFTLFELMMGIAIMGILVSLAVPSFQDYGRNTRVVAVQNDLITAFNYARSEAIRRSATVTVCATSSFTGCGSAAAWSTGWFAFLDANSDGSRQVAEEILQLWRSAGDAEVTFLTAGTNPQRVTFTATGLVTPATGIKTYVVHSTTCESGEQRARRVQINGIGSIRNERIGCP